jgi:hypothetical protein
VRFAPAFLISLFLPFAAFAQADFEEPDFSVGFTAVEGGKVQIFGSGKQRVTDPVVLYVLIGLSLAKEFGIKSDSDAFLFIFKLGGGGGTERSTNTTSLFYDLLVKFRYTLGSPGNIFRPYIDVGPGLITFVKGAFELEGGGGVNVNFGNAFASVGVQYKEVVKSHAYDRGLTYLGSLGVNF